VMGNASPCAYGDSARADRTSWRSTRCREGEKLHQDGPSAGITMAVALTSALSKKPVRADLVFIGELTLTGRVLLGGGVRAKVLAAEPAGFSDVRLPRANLPEVPKETKLTIVGVEVLADVLRDAFRALALWEFVTSRAGFSPSHRYLRSVRARSPVQSAPD